MDAEHTGKALLAVKRYPRKLAAVIIKKPGRETNPSPRRNIRISRIVIGAVEIIDFSRAYQSALNSFQRCR